MNRTRSVFVWALSVAVALALSPALASPANDDFANAEEIAAVPFSASVNTSGATEEFLEPTFCGMTNTIWYRFTPGADDHLVANTFGSDFDTVIAVYTQGPLGLGVADLNLVQCNDDFDGRQSQLDFDATGGTTYYIQVGGWNGQTGNLEFVLAETGAISGTVTNSDGDGLSDICVSALLGEFNYVGFAYTNFDGTYALSDVGPGTYKVVFDDCYYPPRYVEQFYNGKPDFASADPVSVASGTTTTGIDAVMAPLPPPPPPTDLAVTGMSIENVPLQTDYGPAGYSGWVRRVHVSVANLSEVTPSFPALVRVDVCPETLGGCSTIGAAQLDVPAGETVEQTFKWNGFGGAGDFQVTATICSPQPDSNLGNNSATMDHYVIVGGTGFGVSLVPGLFFGPPFPYYCYEVFVVG
jgi:hypothetical protein